MATTITTNQLFDILASIRGAKFATITTLTDVAMRKTNNPYAGLVKKLSSMNVTLNFIYRNSVNAQRAKEGNQEEFVPHERKWGKKIQGTMFVEHKGEFYVEAKMNGAPQNVVYLLENEVIEKEVISEFLPAKSSNKEHQGVEKEIVLRDFKMASIVGLKVDGQEYVVKN